MIKDRCFIVFADDWGKHPSSCQHIFKRLILNNKVLWINTIGMRLPKLHFFEDIKKIIKKIYSWCFHKEDKYGNLVVFSPLMLPFFNSRIYRKINELLLIRQIKKLCRKHHIINPILVTTLPIVADLVGKLGEVKAVYYCVDEFSCWPGMFKRTLKDLEKDLINKIDLILAASEKLYENKKIYGKPIYLFTHGVDYQHFLKTDLESLAIPSDICSIKKPIIGLYGSIDNRVDFEIIRYIAQNHPDWSIVIIGKLLTRLPVYLKRLKNIFFLGYKNYDTLPSYLKFFDVCIMVYKVNDGSIFNSNPVKLKEYLASGKPIVSTPVPEVTKYRQYLKVTDNKEEFLRFIEQVLKENDEKGAILRREAVRNETWDNKVEEFCRYIEV